MPLRAAIVLCLALLMTPLSSNADSSSHDLASYYERHMALVNGGTAACIGDSANQAITRAGQLFAKGLASLGH